MDPMDLEEKNSLPRNVFADEVSFFVTTVYRITWHVYQQYDHGILVMRRKTEARQKFADKTRDR